VKKVYLIHGWDGNPENNWFPWLKKELAKKGFEVKALAMPSPSNPNIDAWINFLSKNLRNIDEDTYLVGHSMGCRAIIGFLEGFKGKVRGVIFVAGWIALTNLGTEEEKEIAEQWTSRKIDYQKVKEKTDKFVAIFSDNDPYVPMEKNIAFYKNKLGAEIITEKGKGHFDDDTNVKELPVVLTKILEISK
jgi:predicted alpha/beta hydrolase family esterase